MKLSFKRSIVAILVLTLLLGAVPVGMAAEVETTVPSTEPTAETQQTPWGDQWGTTYHVETAEHGTDDEEPPQFTFTQLSDENDLAAENPIPLSDAIALVRKTLVNRGSSLVVEIMLEEELKVEAAHLLYDEATLHTGVPDEGDYILRNGTSWGANISWGQRDAGWYHRVEYSFSYYTTAQQEKKVDAEVDRILTKLDLWDATDYQKVCGIYDYICDTVTYDYANLNNDAYDLKYTAYAAFINKTAVCQGYALMFYRLALELGVDARYIRGYANGGNHGWNIVQIAGHYYNLDPTWDAGETTYDYFLRGVNDFPGHTRRDAYETVQFHADYPTSRWNYAAWLDPANGVLEAGYCGADVQWAMYTDNTLAFFGEGAISDYSLFATPWNKYAYRVKNIYMDDGISRVGDSAFAGFDALRGTYISDGVKSIGDYAFYDSDVLTYVGMPADLNSVENYAFYSCGALQRIYFYGSAPKIASSVFYGVYATAYYYNDGTWTTSNRLSYGGSLNWVDIGGYRVIFRNWNGSALYADFYSYGEEIYVPSDPVRPDDDTYTYTFSGWSPAVSATCRGEAVYTATYKARLKGESTVAGDCSGDGTLNNDDVVFLLWYTLFPGDYDVSCSVDFNADGAVNNDDVIYLLWHTLFGNEYPLN